jgi:hypothetical protein
MQSEPDLVEILLQTQVHILLGRIILWTAIGAAAGIAAGLAAYFAMSRAGAWKLRWRHAVWVRGLAALWLVAALGLAGGGIGGCQGALSGNEAAVTEGSLRTEVLRPAGEICAYAIAAVDVALETREIERTSEAAARLQAFVDGKAELDLPALFLRLEALEDALVRDIVANAKREAREKWDLEAGGALEAIVDPILEALARRLIRKNVQERLGPLVGFFDALPRGGISFSALAEHAVERAAIPLILGPTRAFVRGQQTTLLIVALVALSLPALGFWIARRFERPANPETPSTA